MERAHEARRSRAAAPSPSDDELGSQHGARSAHRGADFVALTKPRLNLLVLITTLAGLYLASPDGVADCRCCCTR